MDFLELTLSNRTQFLLGIGITIVSVSLLIMNINYIQKKKTKKVNLPLK